MKLLIAGASGFIGQALVQHLVKTHDITVLGREKNKLETVFDNRVNIATWDELNKLNAQIFNAVINLSGHNIAASRWNDAVKQKIIDSRVKTNQQLIDWLLQQNSKPHFYCANAIGIYGMQKQGDMTAFDEDSPINYQQPKDFLSEIGIRWENALKPAIEAQIPVTITRFGVVLQKNEGMLKKLLPAFYFGAGSIVGSGQQILSWIHIQDVVNAYRFLLDHPELQGSFNLTAPNPVSQAEFAKTLAKTLHRPLWLKLPAFIVKTLFGEMGECLLLSGQRVLPKRLLEQGFQFQFPTLDKALANEFDKN